MTVALLHPPPRTGRRLLAAMTLLGVAVVGAGAYLALTGHPLAAVIGVKGLMIAFGGLLFAVAGVVWLMRQAEEADRDFRPPPRVYGECDRFQPQDINRSRW